MTISPDKEKAVETAMTQIERQFGKGSIMKLGSSPLVDVPIIPSGSLTLHRVKQPLPFTLLPKLRS